MSATYCAAIVGCGDIGHAHAEGYRLNREVDLVAVVDPLHVATAQYQQEYGVRDSFRSIDELLSTITPDIVSICTGHRLHAPMTIAAAEAGVRAIICEKPMGLSLGEVDAMINACDAAGAKLIVSHQRRFTPGWELAKKLFTEGAIGEARMGHGRNSAGLLNVGTHLLDGLLFILGNPRPKWVMGAIERETDRYERGVPIEDRGLVLAELEDGAQLFIQTDLHEWDGRRGIRLRVEGSEGVIEAAEGTTRLLNGSSEGWQQLLNLERVDTMGGRANGRQVAELLRWMEGGPEHRNAAKTARMTTEIIMAAYESARRRVVVRLPLEQDAYPIKLMLDECLLRPSKPGPYDIRSFLCREGIDESRYAELRADGLRHHDIMLRLSMESER